MTTPASEPSENPDICPICKGTMSIATPALKFLHEQVHAEPYEPYYGLQSLAYVLFPRIAKLMEDFARHFPEPQASAGPQPTQPGWYEMSLENGQRSVRWWNGEAMYLGPNQKCQLDNTYCTDFIGPLVPVPVEIATVSNWMALAPPEVREWFSSVTVRNWLREQLNASFQMAGKYDGAMSEECKSRFRRDWDTLSQIIEAIPPAANKGSV